MNLLGVLMAAGVGGMAMLGLNRYFVQLSASQTDLTLRMELQEELKNIRQRTDCAATLQGVDFASVPAGGQAIELKGFPSGAALIADEGSVRGKFAFLADVYPDRSIGLRAALLKQSGASPRNTLQAGDETFRVSPVRRQPWNWAYSDQVLTSTAPALRRVCGGPVSAGTPGKYQVSCVVNPHHVLGCVKINTETGATSKCSYSYEAQWESCMAANP